MKIELPIATVSEAIELTICRQVSVVDADYWTLRMHVDNQSFLIGPWGGWDTREEIDMHAEMFRVALTRAGVADVRVGEVNRAWDRLA